MGLRLPQSWTDDVPRMIAEGVPEPLFATQSKPECIRPMPRSSSASPGAAGRARNRIPDRLSGATEAVLAVARWRKLSWRHGTKGAFSARFAACRIRTADGPHQRIHHKGQQHMPGVEIWLVGEWRSSGERKY